MICINNPNNPTGALLTMEELTGIVEIARKVDAWVLCDEVYRHLTQTDDWCPSIADLYGKGISVSSMSKVFSLAGRRLGWIATRDMNAIRSFLSHRDYNLVSCGMFDEAIAGIALSGAESILKRNRQIVRTNLAILNQWVNAQPHVSYVKPEAGTTALVYYDLDIPSRTFCEEMFHRTGAFATPGECFELEHCLRIGYACDADTLRAGLAAVDDYIMLKEKEMRDNIPIHQMSKLTIMPAKKENSITNARYKANRFVPMIIFTAPRLVIFVAGPVIINEAALPTLIPSKSHCCSKGIVPPPQA